MSRSGKRAARPQLSLACPEIIRCGHTRGKQTVDREQAFVHIQAAIDARNAGADILIMARTDANATEGLDEAIFRARTFVEMGVDITFLGTFLNDSLQWEKEGDQDHQ